MKSAADLSCGGRVSLALIGTAPIGHPSARGRQASLGNRDILKLFETLRVSESFLLKSNTREILLRKRG